MAPRSSPTPRERKPPAKKPVFAAGRQKFAKARPPAPKLIPVSEEMKAWSGLLEQELISWPKVVSRSMFGLLAFYRGAGIFAALPRTRALASARSLIFKLESRSTAVEARLATEARIAKEFVEFGVIGKGWLPFEMSSELDLRDALTWLQLAYERANRKPSR